MLFLCVTATPDCTVKQSMDMLKELHSDLELVLMVPVLLYLFRNQKLFSIFPYLLPTEEIFHQIALLEAHGATLLI